MTRKRGARVFWTPERIADAIRAWARLHGEPPTHNAWSRDVRDDRYPHADTVRRAFGSWNRAIRAAGFDARPPVGGPAPSVPRGGYPGPVSSPTPEHAA